MTKDCRQSRLFIFDYASSLPLAFSAPKQKGEWLPAAIFIFLSHILVGLYSIGFIQYHLFTRSLSSPSSAGIDDFSYYRVSGWMVALTLFSAWLNLLGITAGYHRLWSHNSYKATTSLRIFLAIIGLCSFQGSARWWVLKHRLHHRSETTTTAAKEGIKDSKGRVIHALGQLEWIRQHKG